MERKMKNGKSTMMNGKWVLNLDRLVAHVRKFRKNGPFLHLFVPICYSPNRIFPRKNQLAGTR
jgi:hypothetical protein